MKIDVSRTNPSCYCSAEPSEALLAWADKAKAAHDKMVSLLQVNSKPAELFETYNSYLKENAYKEEEGLFVHGQGYDYVERPSVQPGETMLKAENM